jgi:hypothetical protein
MRHRFVHLLLIVCIPLALAACGDDDDDGGGSPQVFELEASDDGLTSPSAARPGAIEIRFTNSGKQEHGAQIVSLDGHTVDEVKKAGDAWGDDGEPLPEWLTFHGGIGNMKPGTSTTAVVELGPGDYAFFDIEGRGKKPYAEFTVEGDDAEDLPETDGAIEAREYSFTGSDLEAGRGQVLFENVGEEPHHLVAAPIQPGKTIGDVRNFIENEKGEPPIDEEKTFDTAILSGGSSAVIDVDMQSGEYALLCFVPDRAGGPPHAVKGMISAASVE